MDKDAVQEIADEISEREYDRDFYDLDPELQGKIYQRAMQEWHDRMASKAESLEDR